MKSPRGQLWDATLRPECITRRAVDVIAQMQPSRLFIEEDEEGRPRAVLCEAAARGESIEQAVASVVAESPTKRAEAIDACMGAISDAEKSRRHLFAEREKIRALAQKMGGETAHKLLVDNTKQLDGCLDQIRAALEKLCDEVAT